MLGPRAFSPWLLATLLTTPRVVLAAEPAPSPGPATPAASGGPVAPPVAAVPPPGAYGYPPAGATAGVYPPPGAIVYPGVPYAAPQPREETRIEHYYVPIVISDAITATLVTAAYVQKHSGNAILGGFNFTLTPPIIHGVHGRTGMAFASFGVRLGMPLIAATFVGELRSRNSDKDDYVIPSLFVGMIGASILDAAVFARHKITTTTAWVPTPLVNVQRNSATLGLGGAW